MEVAEIDLRYGGKSLIARIAHFSVQEYLQSEHIQQQQEKVKSFAVQREPANTEIAQICLIYLLEPSLCNEFNKNKVGQFPLARYAAENWYRHYTDSEDKPKMDELLERLFVHDTNSFKT